MGLSRKDGSAEQFASQFPADFISEAIDQTRGWFYSQLAISTLLFGEKKVEGGAGKRSKLGRIPIRSKTASCSV
ncbi:MAG: class I tRNA ligase family protein [Pirellulales bacterium]